MNFNRGGSHMKIQLLIATNDSDYAEHISGVLSEKFAETFEVSVCSMEERLQEILAVRTFDVGLLEPQMAEGINFNAIRLPLLLWHDDSIISDALSTLKTVRKYQRISNISGGVLEHYAEIPSRTGELHPSKACITAVWSPAGGVGKTTVALAYAMQSVNNGKRAMYLDLEHFSSSMVYFKDAGKSISVLLEKLGGNVEMLIQSIQQKDSRTGITYFRRPDNYNDINNLTKEDLAALLNACAKNTDELIIDMPCLCDDRMRYVLEAADKVFLVTDPSRAAQSKMQLFMTQHDVFEQIRTKATLIVNKSAKTPDPQTGGTIHLPFVQPGDPAAVFQTLSGYSFTGQGE